MINDLLQPRPKTEFWRYIPLSARSFVDTDCEALELLALWQQGIYRRATLEFAAVLFWMTNREHQQMKISAKYLATFVFLAFPDLREEVTD